MSDLPDSRHDLGSVRPSRWTDQPAVQRKASLHVASNAESVDDCRLLLDMLGLPTSKTGERLSADLSPSTSEVDR